MLVVTTENVPGQRVREVKGQVFGVVVRSRGLGGNIMAGLRVMPSIAWFATRVSCTPTPLS
jgi:uncharacterized protein YbjQ (UPF0145 family)